ncbi:hypothetical protein [Stenotrophomonas sp. BIGb0135]|uniref:hypothetical protein n=1 Tax=Stenotrophomonas sp. BIGb0135 TaxID=2940620 RepID=UPI0021689649|nr:hypothetical protein [Stenotrophomonas sp. BIGb0135]MCS4234400.1 hypothetical protein [Stenotrophomonas sp. BIGb0135]
MRPPCDDTEFMLAPRPQGWVQLGQTWTLWWNGRQIANVNPDAKGAAVTLACRKLWQDKRVRAASIGQGKRYAERWCAARVLPDLPLRQAVERITAKEEPARPARTATERQQERRLREALRPPIVR